jgi:hypothetical protein
MKKFFSAAATTFKPKGNITMKKLWSLSAIAAETSRNFRTVARALTGVKADGRSRDGKPRWHLSTAIAALDVHTTRTGRVPTRAVPERYDPILEAQIRSIEVTGAEVDKFLAELRAAPVERRQELIETGGKCVGRLERALRETIGDGTDAPLRAAYIDQMLGEVLNEALSLCESAATTQRKVLTE